jgi:hypothetical protein
MEKQVQNLEKSEAKHELPYKHCLNCGQELIGKYCHNCGQEVTDKTPTVLAFVMEYLNNAFIWDSKFFQTFWTLIRRPGHLTNEFLSGKFISQEHPLKLNMFLLFVFITLFVFFAGTEKMTDSVHSLTRDERVLPGVQLNTLESDVEYVKKMQESKRDTITLRAPLVLTEEYPEIISNIETKENTDGMGLDLWTAVLPQVLIEDSIVVMDDNGYYCFNEKSKVGKTELNLVNSVLAEMVRIASQYFPMLLLLTAPFLSMSISLVQRKSRLPRINHFIFSLHYTAFLEFLMICVFLLHLTVDPSMKVLECGLFVGSCAYLTVAFRRVYAIKSWFMAIVKSLLTSLIYFIILLLIFIGIFLVACFVIALNNASPI